MNLHEQLGALEMGVDQLIQAVVATQAENTPETNADAAASTAALEHAAPAAAAEQPENTEASAEPAARQIQPTLEINRPARDEITMTIGNQTVALRPDQISRLIEELSNARASMTPEQPPGIPPGWQFVSTKNPVMAVQKQSNGDRLLVMRHTGHGWVPFTFSPDIVIQMYMMLTNAR
jgi:pyruvate/2-oxoglutarate dehydrogenase complex dihydrolipoamide acyltransferase (E2) component